MSIRPPYSVLNNTYPPPLNYPSVSSNSSSVYNMNQNPANIHNALVQPVYAVNKPSHELFVTNDFHKNEYSSAQQSVNVPFQCPTSVNNNLNRMPITVPPPTRFSMPVNQYYPPQPIKQNCHINSVINHESNSDITMDHYQKGFLYPSQNVGCSNLPGILSYEGYPNKACQVPNLPGSDISKTFNSCPQIVMSITGITNNVTSLSDSMNNSSVFPVNMRNSQTVPCTLLNSAELISPQMQNKPSFHVPPPAFKNNISYGSISNNLLKTSKYKKEMKLCEFITKLSYAREKKRSEITVPEFRSVLKAAFSVIKLLIESKCKLMNLKEASINEWNLELQNISNLQRQLSEICSLVSAPIHLNSVMKKLKRIKKKRELKKKTKVNQLSHRIKVEQNRKERNQEVDKYLDDIKEKNLKLKREAEMKKEADYILLEVRKKIHEAKRTIEKIKVFEKLRNARQANAIQKGLHTFPDHNEKFEKKVSCLKETMLKQLADYEAEEKALKVMLETEQEGQLEEETQWKLKKVKTLQQIKKNHIMECLFGNSEDPVNTDSLFLFHKYHTSANKSIENLVQIRHHWDIHIAEDGEAVPQQWVVPVTPSNSSWEQCLTTSVSKN